MVRLIGIAERIQEILYGEARGVLLAREQNGHVYLDPVDKGAPLIGELPLFAERAVLSGKKRFCVPLVSPSLETDSWTFTSLGGGRYEARMKQY